MRLRLIILGTSLGAWGTAHASASDVYLTQDGGPAGVCTTSVQTPAYFNAASNWGPGANQIGPGTTVHLCGTFTGAAGSTLLTAQGGGSSAAPLTILFDTGAVLTSPAWAGGGNPGGGALDFSSSSYAVINGGTNGIIENTENGTSLAYHQTTLAIAIDGTCSHCEVENLTIANLYVHTPGSCDDSNTLYGEPADHTLMNAIRMGAAAGSTVAHVTIHDVGWAILSNANDTTIGPGVDISNIDHGFAFGPLPGETIGGVLFFGNHVHDYAIWDDSMDCNHHDGIHGFSNGAAGTVTTDFWAFDNVFDGDTGTDLNQHIFLEADNDGTPWTTSPASVAYIFNNYFSTSEIHDPPIVGMSGIGTGVFANNTVIGQGQQMSDDTPCAAFGGDGSAPATVANNAIEGCGTLVAANEDTNTLTFDPFDYNAYANCNGYNCFFANLTGTASDTSSFSMWQSQSGLDAHSIADPASVGYGVATDGNYFQIGADGVPETGSPLVGAGTNLSGLCDGGLPLLTALCSDLAGNPRPAGGAWDIGAFEYCGGASCKDGGITLPQATTSSGASSGTGGSTGGSSTSGGVGTSGGISTSASSSTGSAATTGSSSGVIASCVPGASAACTCATGASGDQVCQQDGAYGACTCEPRDGGSAPPPDAGPKTTASSGCGCATSASGVLALPLVLVGSRRRSRR